MIKKQIIFPGVQPLNRASAAQMVQIANRYSSRIMIEHCQKLVNAKSMLGLLSLGMDGQSEMTLLADGADEEQAAAAIMEWLKEGK